MRIPEGIKLESLALPLELLAARISGAGTQHARAIEQVPHMAFWVAAIRAEAVGTVSNGFNGRPKVRYTPTRRDLARLRQGLVELSRTHFEAGATTVQPGVAGLPTSLTPDDLQLLEEAPLDNRKWTWVLSHLFGGCPMGADPATSVVGPDLQVRGVEALHVVDASCLPTTLGVNPQQTIMAVAMVIAEHIAQRAEDREAAA
jgi:choline dehydrogenase-like flavoprotein